MKELGNRFNAYFTRLFFVNDEKDFIDFIVIITFPIWGFIIGFICLIIGLIKYFIRSFKNVKK